LKDHAAEADPSAGGTVAHDDPHADCQSHFEKGKQYLVFASDGYAEANVCAPTGLLSEHADLVAKLDEVARSRKVTHQFSPALPEPRCGPGG
jgi:hypothetical protein